MELKAFNLIIVLLAFVLQGCGGLAPSVPTTLRCPAAPPAGIPCAPCAPRVEAQLPAHLESLQRAYLADRARHEACRLANDGCVRRERVWQESWNACGETQ